MALLDFIKNRGEQRPAGEQQSQQQKPDVSLDAANRSAAQEAPSQKSVGQLPEDVQSRARDIGSRIQQTGESIQQSAPAQQAPEEPTGNPEPKRQMMTAQDNPAPDQSPTSSQAGVPMKDVDAPGPPEPTPPTAPSHRPPSWER